MWRVQYVPSIVEQPLPPQMRQIPGYRWDPVTNRYFKEGGTVQSRPKGPKAKFDDIALILYEWTAESGISIRRRSQEPQGPSFLRTSLGLPHATHPRSIVPSLFWYTNSQPVYVQLHR